MRRIHLVSSLLSLTALEVWSVGLGFEYAAAAVSAKGNTGVTHLGSASAVQYNPGALARIDGAQVEANTFFIFSDAEWKHGDNSYSPQDDPKYSATLYYAHPIEWAWGSGVLGAGVTHSYGQSVTWDSDTPARTFGYDGELRMHQYQLSYGHNFTDTFSAGVTWNWVDSHLKTKGGVALPADVGSFDGDGTSQFFQLGLLYSPHSDWDFGLAYRSAFEVNHDGGYSYQSNFPGVSDFELDAETELQLPPHIIAGVSYHGIEKFSFSLQSQWTGWSVVDEFVVKTPLPDQPLSVDWKDGWIHSLGVTYQLNEQVSLHGGYVYVQSIIPDDRQTLLHADYDQNFLSAGVSWEGERLGIDLALVYTMSNDVNIENSRYAISGDHKADGYLLNVGAKWNF